MTDAEASTAPEKRPRRRWRALRRVLLWSLALFALVFLQAVLFLESPRASEWARHALVRYLESHLEREVEIESLDLDPLVLAAEARGLRLAGPTPEDRPVLEVTRLRVDLALVDLALFDRSRATRLRIQGLEIDHPRFVYVRQQDGSDNLPRWQGGGEREPGARQVELEIGGLDLDAGEILVNERRFPLEVDILGLRFALSGLGGLEGRGELGAEVVEVLLPNTRPWSAKLDARLAFDKESFSLTRGTVVGEGLDAALSAEYRLSSDETPARLRAALGADVDAELVSALGLVEEPLDGSARFDADFVWRGREGEVDPSWRFEGDLSAPELSWFGQRASDVEAGILVEGSDFEVDLRQATFAGGTVSGRLALQPREEADEMPSEAEPPRRATLDLALSGVDLETVLERAQLPIDNLGGRVDGTLEYRFGLSDPLAGDGLADLRVEPLPDDPRRPVRGQLPLLAKNGILSSEAVRLQLPSQSLMLSGDFDVAAGAAQLVAELTSDDVPALLELLDLDAVVSRTTADASRTEAPEPSVVVDQGSGRAEARVTLSSAGIRGDIDLELQDFLAEAAGLRLQADTAEASFFLGDQVVEGLRVSATHGDGALELSGVVPWDGERLLVLALEADRWPLGMLRPDLELAGVLSGRASFDGADALSASLRVDDLARGKIVLGDADAVVTRRGDVIELERLVLEMPAGSLRADGAIDLGRDELRLEASAPALALDAEPFAALLGGGLDSAASLELSLRGPLRQPRGRLVLESEGLVPAGEGSPTRLALDWDGERLEASGGIPGLLRIEGGGRLGARGADLEIALEEIDLGSLARTLASARGMAEEAGATDDESILDVEAWLRDVQGEAAGTLRIEGAWGGPAAPPEATAEAAIDNELAAPFDLDVELVLDQFVASVRERPILALEPIRLRWQDGGILVESLYLQGPAGPSELIVFGRIGLTGEDPTLDLRVDGDIGTHWIDELAPDLLRVRGQFDFLAAIRGTLSNPEVNGQGGVQRGRVAFTGFPHAFEAVDLLLFFYSDRVVLDRLTGRVAEGRIRANGELRMPPRLLDPSGEPETPAIQLRAQIENVELRYPEDWNVRGAAELSFRQESDGSRQLVGRANLDEVAYTAEISTSLTALLRAMTERERVQVEAVNETLASVRLNLEILGPRALRVDNELAELQGDLDLVVTGNLAQPILFGEVRLDPGSKIDWGGEEYRLRQGLLTFADPFENNPLIDVTATTRRREYDIVLNLSGSLDRLEANVSSEPPLAQLDVLSLMTGAEAGAGGISGGEGVAGRSFAEDLLYGQATSLVEGRVESLFGLDRFRLDPLRSGDTVSSTRVTVGKRLSKDIFVTYSVDPSSTDDSVVEVEWRITDLIVLVLSQTADDSYAVDVRVDQSF